MPRGAPVNIYQALLAFKIMGRIACDADDWSRQSQPGQRPMCHTCLTNGQTIGLAFSAYTGAASLTSVIMLFAVLLVKFCQASSGRRKRLISYMDIFLVNLFLAEIPMSLGGLLDYRWANQAQVYCGSFCHTQGTLLFIGETGVSIWTLVITIYTWLCVAHRRHLSFRPIVCLGVMGAVWGYVFGFHFGSSASIRSANDEDPQNYITPTPFWCWVNPKLTHKRLGQYIWLWIAGVGNIVVYGPLYLLLHGNLVLGDHVPRSIRLHWTPPPRNEGDAEEREIRDNAFKLLWYPVTYTVLVLPLSLVRWMGTGNPRWADPQLPDLTSFATAQLVFHALYRLSALVDVALVLATRPSVLLLDKQDSDGSENGSGEADALRSLAPSTELEMQKGNDAGFGGPRVVLGRDDV
ncbi:transmembrane protein [Ceratobasidium sp. AG-Ba]|nr:transmembrane protein [Ceratobasidium sp. AG-Ba]